MDWKVELNKKAQKGAKKLPVREQAVLRFLLHDLKIRGPILPDWKNYSKLESGMYHCHLSYKWVACWKVENDTVRLIKVYYIGSRENAPYG